MLTLSVRDDRLDKDVSAMHEHAFKIPSGDVQPLAQIYIGVRSPPTAPKVRGHH